MKGRFIFFTEKELENLRILVQEAKDQIDWIEEFLPFLNDLEDRAYGNLRKLDPYSEYYEPQEE